MADNNSRQSVDRPGSFLRDKSTNFKMQFFRYIVSGGIAAIVDISVYLLLKRDAGWHYLAAHTVSFGLGTAVIYVLSTHWIFANRNVAKRSTEVLIFFGIGVGGLVISGAAIYVGVEWLGLDKPIPFEKLLAIGCHFVWNFSARKLFLFRDPKTSDPRS